MSKRLAFLFFLLLMVSAGAIGYLGWQAKPSADVSQPYTLNQYQPALFDFSDLELFKQFNNIPEGMIYVPWDGTPAETTAGDCRFETWLRDPNNPCHTVYYTPHTRENSPNDVARPCDLDCPNPTIPAVAGSGPWAGSAMRVRDNHIGLSFGWSPDIAGGDRISVSHTVNTYTYKNLPSPILSAPVDATKPAYLRGAKVKIPLALVVSPWKTESSQGPSKYDSLDDYQIKVAKGFTSPNYKDGIGSDLSIHGSEQADGSDVQQMDCIPSNTMFNTCMDEQKIALFPHELAKTYEPDYCPEPYKPQEGGAIGHTFLPSCEQAAFRANVGSTHFMREIEVTLPDEPKEFYRIQVIVKLASQFPEGINLPHWVTWYSAPFKIVDPYSLEQEQLEDLSNDEELTVVSKVTATALNDDGSPKTNGFVHWKFGDNIASDGRSIILGIGSSPDNLGLYSGQTMDTIFNSFGEAEVYVRWQLDKKLKPTVVAVFEANTSNQVLRSTKLEGQLDLKPQVSCIQSFDPETYELLEGETQPDFPSKSYKVGQEDEILQPFAGVLDCTITQRNLDDEDVSVSLNMTLSDQVSVSEFEDGIRNDDGSVTWVNVTIPANGEVTKSVNGIRWLDHLWLDDQIDITTPEPPAA